MLSCIRKSVLKNSVNAFSYVYIQTLSGLQNNESCKHVAYSKNRQPTPHFNENDEDKKLLFIKILQEVAIIFDKLKINLNLTLEN